MAKFNSVATGTKASNSTNTAGGKSYTRDDFRQEIASAILTSMLNGDSYYEKEVDRLNRIESLINTTDNERNLFIAKSMVYVRNEANLRSISHFMAGVLLKNAKGTDFMRSALRKTMIRPDDATEILSLINSKYKTIPNVFRRAVKDQLETTWDEYQLKKYAMPSKGVKLKDLVKLAHPDPKRLVMTGKAKDDNVFKRVIEDSLENIETVQTVNAGNTGVARAEAYKDMLLNRKMGYMAAMKNIVNMLEAKVDDDTISMWCSLITNTKAVENSRLLPFRFAQAYGMMLEFRDSNKMSAITVQKVLDAIEDAIILSAGNIPVVENGERVAILLDESGSMGGFGYDRKSSFIDKTPFNLGKILTASMLTGLNSGTTLAYLWSDRSRQVSIRKSPMEFIESTNTQGGGTDIYSAIEGLINSKTVLDKIIIMTDMEMYSLGGTWNRKDSSCQGMLERYRREINKDVKVLFWNLQGNSGGTPAKLTNNVMEVSGFSDNLLPVVAKMWKDPMALVNEIEAIQL